MGDLNIPFYFNGRELSAWACRWHLLGLPFHTGSPEDGEDWDEFIGYRHIWHLECRLDHRGVVESEDPLIFRVCAQEVLCLALQRQEQALESIRLAAPEAAVLEVYHGILHGLAAMIAAAHHDRRALWTSGDESDLKRLQDTMAKLPPHPPFQRELAEPHVIQRRSELLLRSSFQLTTLRRLAQSGSLPKEIRKLLHELPPNDGGHD